MTGLVVIRIGNVTMNPAAPPNPRPSVMPLMVSNFCGSFLMVGAFMTNNPQQPMMVATALVKQMPAAVALNISN